MQLIGIVLFNCQPAFIGTDTNTNNRDNTGTDNNANTDTGTRGCDGHRKPLLGSTEP